MGLGHVYFQPSLGLGQQTFKPKCEGGSRFFKQPLFEILHPPLLFDHSLRRIIVLVKLTKINIKIYKIFERKHENTKHQSWLT